MSSRLSFADALGSWLLAAGLVFSVSSQLRVPGAGVGPGELLLVAWLVTRVVGERVMRPALLAPFLGFWGAAALLLAAGRALGTYPVDTPRPGGLHDAMAYALCVVLGIAFLTQSRQAIRQLPERLLAMYLASAAVAVVVGLALRSVTGVDAMYYGVRWQHLSNNPNQFALMVLPMPFLALRALRQPGASPVLPVTAFAVAIGLGLYSHSDALSLAWLGGSVLVAGGWWWMSSQGWMARPALRSLASLLLAVMLVSMAWQWRFLLPGVVRSTQADVATDTAAAAASAIYKAQVAGTPMPATAETSNFDADQSQAGLRVRLWRHGLQAATSSPVVGLGPGPHSGYVKAFDGVEAHNSVLDWATQAGGLGVLVLLAYAAILGRLLLMRAGPEAIAMVASLACFSLFHFTMRQPLFWLLPLLAALLPGRVDDDAA